MSCNKRVFGSPEEARAQLRVWQQRSRRSAFDTTHIYKCDEPEHRGKFHVGIEYDKVVKTPTRRDYDKTRSQIFGSLDDLFYAQEVRIKGKLNPRPPRETRTQFEDVSLININSVAMDDFNVENKK